METADAELCRLDEILRQVENTSISPRVARQLDREAVQALVDVADPDGVAGHVDVERVGGLADRWAAALAEQGPNPDLADRTLTWDLLDRLRRSQFLTRVPKAQVAEWADRFLSLVRGSHLTVGPLFRQRAAVYPYKSLFEVPRGDSTRSVSWLQAASRIDFLARGLLSLDSSESPAPIAILSDNSLDMALVDLGCLTAGLFNVMIPANATEADVGFMLKHSGAGSVVVSNRQQLKKVLPHREGLPQLRRILSIAPLEERQDNVLTLDELMARAVHIPGSLVAQRSEAVRIDDRATVMYTSGTTGVPKGIQFSHQNLVFKRFARALALPEIGDQDVLVCFLPLFHTFGRFLEMMGCVFWGSTYVFVENASVDTLVQAMRHHRPTVFISVPKKWIELYEAIGRRVDLAAAHADEIREATRQVVGDRLRWGLSAAGYLDAEIFRFFQSQGIELMSGFGMTEATGGITMTPPGEYRDDSLGLPLPGITTRLADDGELLIRGPYVMQGYLDPPEGEESFDEQGWFHSGDLMEMDPAGHIRLVDRKKEIYKNVKGETIAPQRIENLFRDFASVGRVFLVGDHKAYNTLLLYPQPDYAELDFSSIAASEVRDHFRSLVVSVNKFLAPYERVVDFAIIDRDLDAEQGELTPKGTPRRKKIAANFAAQIQQLYRRTNLHVGSAEITFPNWLFQALGLTAQDIVVDSDRIRVPSRDTQLTVRSLGEGRTHVGDFVYSHSHHALNLGSLLTTPRLWLGNGELVDFVPLSQTARQRQGRDSETIDWVGYARTQDAQPQPPLPEFERPDLFHVDSSARKLASVDEETRVAAVRELLGLLGQEVEQLVEPTRLVLSRTATDDSDAVAKAAFCALIPRERDSRFTATLQKFLGARTHLLDSHSRQSIAETGLSESKLLQLTLFARDLGLTDPGNPELAEDLLNLLATYITEHPTAFRLIRSVITRLALFAPLEATRSAALGAYHESRAGFRAWLGTTDRIAVDPDTRTEYRWSDVAIFENEIPDNDRERLMSALEHTTLVSEGIFMISFGAAVRLSDIPRGGLTLRMIGSRHGKSVYRMTVQTRHQGTFDIAVNVNGSIPTDEIQEEIRLLILCGEPLADTRLVEDFGGYYPAYDLWTEEFITGETLDRAIARLAREDDQGERLRDLWPFLAWSALGAYIEFWNRSGRQWEIGTANFSNVVVPTQDYQTGARLVSLHGRRRHESLLGMLQNFRDNLLPAAESKIPSLRGSTGWSSIFAALLEVVGEDEGLALLEGAIADSSAPAEMKQAFRKFRRSVDNRGFLPLRLYFAVQRYGRWADLNADSTLRARARTLQGLYETYSLERLTGTYPELRARFFRETVFRNAPPALADGLEALIARVRSGEVLPDEIIDAVADLRSRIELGPDEDYFLARVSFPYLRPEDAAGYVSSYLGGRPQSEMVVSIHDSDRQIYRIRHALNPKEVERLHRLFVAARLDVRFRPEHQYLVVISERSQIIGGIFYEIAEDGETAQLEKIVIADAYRRKGIAEALMQEFFNRMRAVGVTAITTGFFRPEYFSGYGFKIEKRYAGLVKSLTESP